MPTERPPSVLASLLAWLCLCGGIALIGGVSLARPLLDWEAARRERLVAEGAAERAGAEAERLDRLLAALRFDPLFREEWHRVEWERPPAEDAVPVPDALRIDPRVAAAEPVMTPTRPAWTLPVERVLADAALFRGLAAVAALAIATGLLARPHRGAAGVLATTVRSLGGRYRRDDAHGIPPPHAAALREAVVEVAESPQP